MYINIEEDRKLTILVCLYTDVLVLTSGDPVSVTSGAINAAA